MGLESAQECIYFTTTISESNGGGGGSGFFYFVSKCHSRCYSYHTDKLKMFASSSFFEKEITQRGSIDERLHCTSKQKIFICLRLKKLT